MKIRSEKIPPSHQNSFLYFDVVRPVFQGPLHYHPEIEIVEIVQGHGYRIIGEHQEYYERGDLVLIGSRIYHGYFGYHTNTRQANHARVVQFDYRRLKPALDQLPELKSIFQILRNLQGAVVLSGETRHFAHLLLTRLFNAQGVQSLLYMLNIIQLFISESSDDRQVLSSPAASTEYNEVDYGRLNEVFDLIHSTYSQTLTLTEMADYVGLSNSTLSRTFHEVTGRTFTRYVNEIRIGNACRLLIETDFPIYQIANLCGFDNLSNFNRRFQDIIRSTPSKYRKLGHVKLLPSTSASVTNMPHDN